MNNSLNLSRLFLFSIFCLVEVPLWAGPADWSFLPASTVFKPLIGNPREPIMGLVGYLDQTRYEGQVASTLEVVRYSPDDDVQFGWGLFAAGYILLDQDGSTFPMRDGDFYIGTYFSGNFGDFSARLEGLHESTHLGDSLEGQQQPLFYNQYVNYSRENVNGTLSFQPSEFLRIYASAGIWDFPLIIASPDPFFASFGTELYTPSWPIDRSSMRGYATAHFEWDGDVGVWDEEFQLGIQWKSFKDGARDIRMAVLYYTGDSQFGQFYNTPDNHWALATFFDF